MARTKQTARRSTRTYDSDEDHELDEEDQQEINGRITEEEKKRIAELKASPMQAELKHLEKRYTKKGRSYITEPQEDEELPDQSFSWYEKFALCITRAYDTSNKYVQRTSLQINSSSLKKILGEVIGNYPGLSFVTKDIDVPFPPRALYHYRLELKQELRRQEPDSEAASHLPVLLSFIDEQFEETIKTGDNLREKGFVNYELLWTIFKPGITVFTTKLGQPRVYKLRSYSYECGMSPCFRLDVEYVSYDGDSFGTKHGSLQIPLFEGAVPITGLPSLPLSYHPAAETITKSLIQRGRKWESLAGQNFKEYSGVAFDAKTCERYNIVGRVMIDCATFHRMEPGLAFSVYPFQNAVSAKRKHRQYVKDSALAGEIDDTLDILTNEQCLLAAPVVRGFSFTEKLFLEFAVDKLHDIDWNTTCFEQLVLPESQKELVQALVAEHTHRTENASGAQFDDIVKGKGKGLILVLHGPPGVGKTLTAECVAEFSRRPLYIVSSGDLGTDCSVLDRSLTRILDLASTWKAVLLIDEADVFLERRSLHDLQRNALVSIFLRTLEYYAGILFMTTNRVASFDDAFKSRIHVPLKYDELPHSSRARIWKNFLKNMDGKVDISEDGIQRLAEGQLNGRQIKNVVRTAGSLSNYKRVKLDEDRLKQVLDIQLEFERELDSRSEKELVMVEK